VIAYKFLRPGAVGPFSGVPWPAPSAGRPGAWVTADAAPRPCVAGVHACRAGDLSWWLDAELWRIELDGQIVEAPRKLVAQRGRLVERVDAWTAATATAFAEACVLRVRDGAAAALPESEAAQLAQAGTRAEVEAAVAALPVPGDPASPAAQLLGYLGDAILETRAGAADPESVTAHAAAAATIADAAAILGRDDARAVIARERAWQARWLAGALRL